MRILLKRIWLTRIESWLGVIVLANHVQYKLNNLQEMIIGVNMELNPLIDKHLRSDEDGLQVTLVGEGYDQGEENPYQR